MIIEMENVIIKGNVAKTSGGGIFTKGKLRILGSNTKFLKNSAGKLGGGLYVQNYAEIENGKFVKNHAGDCGGGIYIYGEAKLENEVNFCGNTHESKDYKGIGEDIFYRSGYLLFNIDKETLEEKKINIYPEYFRDHEWITDSNLNLKEIKETDVTIIKSLKRDSVVKEDGKVWNISTNGASGMTVSDKYIVFAQVDDDGYTTINILDKNTYKFLNINEEYKFKHANDMAYNEDTDEFYVMTSSDEIAKFKIDDKDDKYQMTKPEYISFKGRKPDSFSGFAYDKDDKYYIGYKTGKMYIMNNNFEDLYNFETAYNFNSETDQTVLSPQGISYWNHHIFFSCYESRTENRGSNVIYMYTMDGTLEKTLYIPKTVVRGEIEAVSFDENGTLILEYNINERGERYVELYKSNSDIISPTLEVSYSTTEMTNGNVVVTINSNEEIQAVDGWKLSTNKRKLTKTYTQNKTENIKVTDLAGNTSIVEIDIKNIDKQKPTVEVNYSTNNPTLNNVVVTIIANEELKEVEGWILSNDKKTLSKTYIENAEETVTIYDLAGNSIVKTITINNINRSISEIAVKEGPEIKTSILGQELDLSNEKLIIKFQIGETKEIALTKEMIGNSFNKNQLGLQRVTVIYGGQETTFLVIVTNNVTGIAIKKGTVPESSVLGQELNLTNAKIIVTRETGETEEVAITKEMLGESFNKNKLGLQTVTVTYEEQTAKFNVTLDYTEEQKAIREVADAYYNRKEYSQYSSYRKTFIDAPEDATSQHTTYKVCSGFVFNVYYNAFGIKLPPTTKGLGKYGRENVKNSSYGDVIEYIEDLSGLKNEYENGTDKWYNLYGKKILNELEIGDVLSMIDSSGNGHSELVYEIEYDENGNRIDAIVRTSPGENADTTTTKLKKGLGYYEDGYVEKKLLSRHLGKASLISWLDKKSTNTGNNMYHEFTIIRPLLKDENGNYTGKYRCTIAETNTEPNIDGTWNYEITNATKQRIKYSKIYIEKTVYVFNNSVVSPDEELKYIIKIKNNSEEDYKDDIIATENISEYVTFDENSTITITMYSKNKNDKTVNTTTIQPEEIEFIKDQNGKIIRFNINIGKIKSNDENVEIEYVIEYTVKVNENTYGETIESTGEVASISSGTIKNTVGRNLTQSQINAIKNVKFEDIKDKDEKQLTGKELINEIYKKSLGIDLSLENFDITGLVITKPGTAYYLENMSTNPLSRRIHLNSDNAFYKMVLTNYYGATNKDEASGETDLKYWEKLDGDLSMGRDIRADNIYGKNFKTGDVLIYKNTQISNGTYRDENGTYYLIYIDEKDKITIDEEEIYGFIGIDEDGTLNRLYRSEYDFENQDDYSIYDLRTLLGKDNYVILRPSLIMCNINYELDGGNNSELNPNIYLIGDNTELQNPTRKGYSFDGWYLDREHKNRITNLEGIENDITIYAKWNLNVTGIAIKEGTVPETSILGQDLDLSSAKIVVTYEVGEPQEISITKEMLGKSFNKDLLGPQTITVTYEEQTATFNVTVIEEFKVDIKEMDLDENDGVTYLSTTTQNITEDDLKSKIITNGDVAIEAKGPNGEIGTGSKIKISKNGKTLEYTLIIMGDLTGDGLLDDRDLLKMARYGVNLDKSLTGAYLRAGNIVKDENFANDVDLLKMARILVGLDNL